MQIIADAFWSTPHAAGCTECRRKTTGNVKRSSRTKHHPLPSPHCQHRPPQAERGPTALQDKELPRETPASWAELVCNGHHPMAWPLTHGMATNLSHSHQPAARPPTCGTATDPWHGHRPAARPPPQGRNLPVPMILSILTLALSSSLAKRCTACTGSSQVSGSMYVLLVGILTARKQQTPKGRGKGWAVLPACPGKCSRGSPISRLAGRTNLPPFNK